MRRLRSAVPWTRTPDPEKASARIETKRLKAEERDAKQMAKAAEKAATDAAKAEQGRVRAEEKAVTDAAKAEEKAERDRQRQLERREAARKAFERETKEYAKTAAKLGISLQLYRAMRSDKAAFVRDRVSVSERELVELYRSISANKLVIVRKYKQLHGGSSDGQKAFEGEANILARHGYTPTSQGFAANNVFTGISVGTGEIVVSYAKRSP